MAHPLANKTAVLDVVGLTPGLIGVDTPRLRAFRDAGSWTTIRPPLPAVTCTSQATYLTGVSPRDHGIVGNGWYFRETAEVRLWQQADALVGRPRLWENVPPLGRTRGGVGSANVFWWYAMYARCDVSVTPRPVYLADGRKIPDVWTNPPGLRDELQRELGKFPLFHFWGPRADLTSTQWIAQAAKRVELRYDPTLTTVYLPHLDYPLQKYGPHDPRVKAQLRAVDDVAGDLIDFYRDRGAGVVVLSEYGIEPANRPVHLNRVLRAGGWVAVREEAGTDRLDPGASRAFAVADHQVAHVYVKDPADVPAVAEVVASTPGVDRVWAGDTRAEIGLDHPRAGDVVAVAEPKAWFTYYFWDGDARAPDYARTVDIHRKPGYDPVELFTDVPAWRIASKLARRKLGLRTLLDVIPLDATKVKGTHGRFPGGTDDAPILISDRMTLDGPVEATGVAEVLRRHVGLATGTDGRR